MLDILNFIRLRLVLLIEKNRNTKSRFNKFGELEQITNIRPIISSYISYFEKRKEEIECVFDGKKFSKIESIVIHTFTADGSNYINHELASPAPKISFHKRIIIRTFDSVLKKIGRIENEYVYRMDVESKSFHSNAISFFSENKGKIINIPWFLSTTEHSDPWDTRIVWKIKIVNNSKTKARHFYPLINNHGDEKEIRFERNAKFRIVDILEIKDKHSVNYYIVNMTEMYNVKSDINLNYSLYRKQTSNR